MIVLLAEVASRFDWTEGRHQNLVPSKPDSIWGPVMIQISKLKRVFLGFRARCFTLWSGEMKCSPWCYIFDFKCGEPTPFDRWRLDVQVCWSEICQVSEGTWVWVAHELSGRQSDLEKKFTSCMVVIFHSMWVVHLQLIPLLKTSSRLVRPHCLDSSDLFYFILFFFPRLNLSSAWKPVFAKVSLRSKWISSLTGCDLKCLWAESELCVQSLSLSFFPSPG